VNAIHHYLYYVVISISMADDLDDFFNDVEEAEAKAHVVEEKGGDKNKDDRPTKRQKVGDETTTTASKTRPRGVVVAASSSVVNKAAAAVVTTKTQAASSVTSSAAVGPLPPPSSHDTHLPTLPPGPPPPPPPPPQDHKPKKPVVRQAAGKTWVDTSLADWPENDYRIFVGNLSRDVTDDMLLQHFASRYSSTAMAKIVLDHKTGVSKGYGFVSFLQPLDCAKAIREQDQKWLGSRPIKVKRSDWKERNLNEQKKLSKKQQKKEKRYQGF
jgi:hypothetical protein